MPAFLFEALEFSDFFSVHLVTSVAHLFEFSVT